MAACSASVRFERPIALGRFPKGTLNMAEVDVLALPAGTIVGTMK